MKGTVDTKCCSEVTSVVAHVATLLTLAHKFTRTRAGRKIAGHNAAAPHWLPCFLLRAMLSEVTSHQRLKWPNAVIAPPSDVHTPCHSDLSSTGSLRCDQCTSCNSHSMLHIAHVRLRPQHRPAHAHSNPPLQAVTIVHLKGLEPSSVLSRLLYTLLRATIRTLGRKSVNRCSCAARTNSEGSTNCMPTPRCRQHPLSYRKVVPALKP